MVVVTAIMALLFMLTNVGVKYEVEVVREVPIDSGIYKAVDFSTQWIPIFVPSDGKGCGEPIIEGGTTAPNGDLIYANIDMTLQPESGRNRMELQLTNMQTEDRISTVLEQASDNPLVYVDDGSETSIEITLSELFVPDVTDTIQVAIKSGIYESGKVPLSLTLPRIVPNEYSNYTMTLTDIVPLNPSNSGQGVFYIRVKGLSSDTESLTIRLSSGENSIEVEAEAVPSKPGVVMTSKLALLSDDIDEPYPDVTTLTVDRSYGGFNIRIVESKKKEGKESINQ